MHLSKFLNVHLHDYIQSNVRTLSQTMKKRSQVRFADRHDEGEKNRIDTNSVISKLHPVLQWDYRFVTWCVHQRDTNRAIEILIVSTTSRIRTQDISFLLWLLFIAMLPDLGFPYLWICVVNLLVVTLLQYAAQIDRPCDLNHSLTIPSCMDPDTNGFPCVESHMSIVVLLPVIENTSSGLMQLLVVSLICYIAFSRLCLATRFGTQIMGSWLTGLTGIILGNHGHMFVKACKLPRDYQYVLWTFVYV